MKRIGSGTDMKINRMAVVQGLNLETVPGQLRYGCSMTDFEDFYDIAEYVNEKAYLGNQIVFGDYETGEVYTPFEKERIKKDGKVTKNSIS